MVEVNVRTPVTFSSTFLSLHSFYSKHTGNDTYRALTENAVRHLAGLPTPLPGKHDFISDWVALLSNFYQLGLAPQGIDPTTGKFVGAFLVRCFPSLYSQHANCLG